MSPLIFKRKEVFMKNIVAGFLCVCLCISIAIFLPKVGTTNPAVDDTGCLASGCHDFATLHTTHPGACDACHETASGGGAVASATCLACHPAENSELCDLALAHPEAGCLAEGCHATCEVTEGCAVTIACEETTLCTDDECTTCTATTECDGETVEGVYSWSLNGEATTANTGNAIEICPDDLELGSNTLTVTDTANEEAEDTETLTLEECGAECQIDVLRDSLPKSHWFFIPVLLRIETIGIEDLNARTSVAVECDGDGPYFPSLLKTGKVVIPPLGTNTTVIWQTGIVLPALLTQSLELDSETCTVTVGDCAATDTFELNYLSLGAIPLSQ
jgi:hypothetical protein